MTSTMTVVTSSGGQAPEAAATSPTIAAGPADAAGPRVGRAKRRTFTSEYKQRIVAEYDAAPLGEKGAVLRRELLYDSHVQEWRAAQAAGALDAPPKRGGPRKTSEQAGIAELERQVARLEAEAAKKDEVIVDRDAALEVLGEGCGPYLVWWIVGRAALWEGEQ